MPNGRCIHALSLAMNTAIFLEALRDISIDYEAVWLRQLCIYMYTDKSEHACRRFPKGRGNDKTDYTNDREDRTNYVTV